jgi:hypothetical protein
MKPFSYTGAPPSEYKCDACGAKGCKLWRRGSVFGESIYLWCCDCAQKEECLSGPVKANGKVHDALAGWTDQIGSLVPAVPTEDGEDFWGYSSVPKTGASWWKGLPNEPQGMKPPVIRFLDDDHGGAVITIDGEGSILIDDVSRQGQIELALVKVFLAGYHRLKQERDVCVVCGCWLLAPSQPPHCEDCHPDHDQLIDWEESQR